MTHREIFDAATKSKYVRLRQKNGHAYSANSKLIFKILNQSAYKPNKETQYQSVTPISFEEYIQTKLPFITE